jgi:hypothetical protein
MGKPQDTHSLLGKLALLPRCPQAAFALSGRDPDFAIRASYDANPQTGSPALLPMQKGP